jgi:hypothetical protein
MQINAPTFQFTRNIYYIDKCENVQRYFTKRLPGLWNVPYTRRLEILNLESLEMRRLRMDMICVYKLFHGLFNLNATDFFILSQSVTRGHNFKIFKPRYEHCFAQHFFSYRVIAVWNSLPNSVVCAHNINAFKCCLNDFNFSKYCKGRAIC